MYLNCPQIFKKDNFVTNNYLPPNEGFGYQYSNIINSMLFAEIIRVPFHYTPFQAMAHNYDNDPEFLTKKEKLINIIDHFPINQNIDIQKSHFVGISNNLFPGSKTQQKVKQLFFAEKNKEKYFQNAEINIAIHIRKRNAEDIIQAFKAYCEDISRYGQFLDFLRSQSPHSARYHIYAQGDPNEFGSLEAEDVSLHLNETIEDTFCAMVFADVLITAYSCLSYADGLLSNGTVYYFPIPSELMNYTTNSFNDGSIERYPNPCLSPLPNWLPIRIL